MDFLQLPTTSPIKTMLDNDDVVILVASLTQSQNMINWSNNEKFWYIQYDNSLLNLYYDDYWNV